jgi:acetyl esterase
LADTAVELAPEVQALLAWDRALGQRVEALPIAEQRAAIREAVDEFIELRATSAAHVAATDEYEVPVDGATLRMRVYTPGGKASFGAFFHIHGGGFTLGGIDWAVNHAKCAYICAAARCVVTSIEYRLAPEFPYPTAAEDCYAALLWLVEHASRLRIDTRRIVVGGESAGGNLAAVTALMARDRKGPNLALQLLEVPVVDMSARSGTSPSMRLFGDGYGLDTPAIEAFVDAYLPNAADREEAYASPLRAANLTGVAPAHVITAEYDPLRDAGEAYARRLQEAGVMVSVCRFSGQTHGSSVLWSTWEPSGNWMDKIVRAVRDATRGRIAAPE